MQWFKYDHYFSLKQRANPNTTDEMPIQEGDTVQVRLGKDTVFEVYHWHRSTYEKAAQAAGFRGPLEWHAPCADPSSPEFDFFDMSGKCHPHNTFIFYK